MTQGENLEELIISGGNSEPEQDSRNGELNHQSQNQDYDEIPFVDFQQGSDCSKKNKKNIVKTKEKNGGGKDDELEDPPNCPHLETGLFYFGVGGMIVSLCMLLHHIFIRFTPYY